MYYKILFLFLESKYKIIILLLFEFGEICYDYCIDGPAVQENLQLNY